MATDHDIDTKIKKSKAAAFVGASLSSLLSGNPFSRDEFYHLIRTYIENGRYTKNMQAFSTACTKFEDQHKAYDTVVINSSHGAYLLVKTAAPALDEDGQPCNKPIYSLLFSQYPDFLQDMFVRKRDSEWERPSKEEIETKISVVASHWEDDIVQRNKQTGETRVVKSWVQTAITNHNSSFEKNLKRHGSIMRDGETMWRSGSSIFWLKEDPKNEDKFNIYYYSNPVYGQLSLFVTERALKNSFSRHLMHFFSVKLSPMAMTKKEAEEFVSHKYGTIAQGIFNNQDPYDVTAPEHRSGKIGRMAKKIPVRVIQKMSNSLLNIDKKSLLVASGVTLALTGVLWLAFSTFFFAAGAVSKGASNLGMKGVQGLFRTVGKFASPVKTKTVNALNDMSALLAANKKNNIITEENGGLMLNADYVDFMDPVQKPFLESTFPDIKPMDQIVSGDPIQDALVTDLKFDPAAILDDADISDEDLAAKMVELKEAANQWAENKLCEVFGLEAGTDLSKVTKADLKDSRQLPNIISASDEWAKGVLLDTMGIQPGTIFTDVELNGRTFLQARQPNGLDVYYDPEEHVAIAHIVRDPHKGFSLEKPIERLFNSIPVEDYVIAIRQGDRGALEMISFATLDDIPEDFIRQKSKSMSQINNETVNLDEIGSYTRMGLYQFVTEKEANKWRKIADKKLALALQETFENEAARLDGHVDDYCLRRSYDRAAKNIMTLDDMPSLPAIANAQDFGAQQRPQ